MLRSQLRLMISALGRAFVTSSIAAAAFAGPGRARASKNFTAISWIPGASPVTVRTVPASMVP